MPKKGLDGGVADRWRKPIFVLKDFLGIQALCDYRITVTLYYENIQRRTKKCL